MQCLYNVRRHLTAPHHPTPVRCFSRPNAPVQNYGFWFPKGSQPWLHTKNVDFRIQNKKATIEFIIQSKTEAITYNHGTRLRQQTIPNFYGQSNSKNLHK